MADGSDLCGLLREVMGEFRQPTGLAASSHVLRQGIHWAL